MTETACYAFCVIETHEVAPWIERLARVGYVAKVLLYGTIGALAALAAFSPGGRTMDTRGAMRTLLDAPMGRALLTAIALGLLGYALWWLVEGALDPERRGSDVKALAVRASFIVRGLAHGLLALSAAKLALGKPSSGDDEKGEQATRAAFELPAGDLIVCGPPQSVSRATECTSSIAPPRRS